MNLDPEELAAVVAFLEVLTDMTVDSAIIDLTVPLTVPSGLTPPVDEPPFAMIDTGRR